MYVAWLQHFQLDTQLKVLLTTCQGDIEDSVGAGFTERGWNSQQTEQLGITCSNRVGVCVLIGYHQQQMQLLITLMVLARNNLGGGVCCTLY